MKELSISYVLIIPIKDEEKYIPQLKKVILSQTIQPLFCVIVDSGSEDRSFFILNEVFKEFDWISIIKQKKFYEKGYSHNNFAQAINEGYDYAKTICTLKNIDYKFVGKTDATPILFPNYFELLLICMNKNKNLAFSCGAQKLIYYGKSIEINPIRNIQNTGVNDIRLYSKIFFEEMGGYPLTPTPDGVILIKAINRNWEIERVEEAHFIKTRIGGTKIGIWKGNILKGMNMYCLGYHPFLAVLTGLEHTIRIPPHYQIFPILQGYFSSWYHKLNRIDDLEITEYYGKTRLKMIFSSLLKR